MVGITFNPSFEVSSAIFIGRKGDNDHPSNIGLAAGQIEASQSALDW